MQRFLDRSASMAREKRGLDSGGDGDGGHPEPKRRKVPALASVIVEALKLDSLQKLCSSLEPVLRRVVSEEVERALAKFGPARLGGRPSPKRIEGPDGRNLQLHFRSRLSLPLFTGGKVVGDQGATIHVLLIDASTGHVITSGLESSAKLDVVVLDGDFNNEDGDDWTKQDFESHVVREREGKRPLLTGDLQVSLKDGVGTLGELMFTDNSSWIRSRKFRLGLKIDSGFCEGIRIREAKTEAFAVKDHRGELYKKHYPPTLKDEVWRLEKIGKDGQFHKRLNKAGIHFVEDFLRLVVRDAQRLRHILGSGMSNKMWEILVEHAKTCVSSGRFYVYYTDDTKSIGAIFNNIYEFSGLIAGGQYYLAECLTDSQKVFVDSLVKKAYDNWMHVIEYDVRALSNFKLSKETSVSPNETPPAPASYSVSYDQQVSRQLRSAQVPFEQQFIDTQVEVKGITVPAMHNWNQETRYPPRPRHATSNFHMQLESTPFVMQNQYNGSSHQAQITRNSMGLGLGQPQQTDVGFHPMSQPIQQPANLDSYDDWSRPRGIQGVDDFLSEEEIRMKSHEMLESEDMQDLLRVFRPCGASASLPEDGCGFPSFMPTPCQNYNFGEDRSRSSRRAVGWWIKIKAAMRWGIFVRKKAAETRARLVELDD